MYLLPEVPVSAGAVIRDGAGRILVLNPTYKPGWTLPGGVMEDDGETPWEACVREVREETGLHITRGRLIAVDSRPSKPGRKLGLRFLFDCGTVTDAEIRTIRLQAVEISEHRFASRDEARELLRKPVRRRLTHALRAKATVYLENGRPVDGVG